MDWLCCRHFDMPEQETHFHYCCIPASVHAGGLRVTRKHNGTESMSILQWQVLMSTVKPVHYLKRHAEMCGDKLSHKYSGFLLLNYIPKYNVKNYFLLIIIIRLHLSGHSIHDFTIGRWALHPEYRVAGTQYHSSATWSLIAKRRWGVHLNLSQGLWPKVNQPACYEVICYVP